MRPCDYITMKDTYEGTSKRETTMHEM